MFLGEVKIVIFCYSVTSVYFKIIYTEKVSSVGVNFLQTKFTKRKQCGSLTSVFTAFSFKDLF